MTERNYEQDLAIDPHELDECWLKHPALYMQYSRELADAQRTSTKAKEKLDVVRAEVDKDIRTNPDKFNLQKVTEGIVSATIALDERYREAQSDLNEKIYEVNILQGAVRAFDHRKKALENMVQLLMMEYFAGPKEPRNLPPGKRMADKAAAKATDSQREGLNRRRRKK